jgi:hypothetical protein
MYFPQGLARNVRATEGQRVVAHRVGLVLNRKETRTTKVQLLSLALPSRLFVDWRVRRGFIHRSG